jgi:hypothetical protein
MTDFGPQKRTTVRFKNAMTRAFFRYGEYVAPELAGRVACRWWFTAPPRMGALPVPDRGEVFELDVHGHAVRGHVWGEGPVVYLMHGWGGRSRDSVW